MKVMEMPVGELPPGLHDVPLLELDAARVLPGFIQSFADTSEYCDWTESRFREQAEKVVGDFFSGKRGRALPASRAVLDEKGQPVAVAMLVALRRRCAFWDVMWVVPQWRRHGLASYLLAAALGDLAGTRFRTLMTQWQIANETSMAWHHRMGFKEVPDLTLTRLHLREVEDELRLHGETMQAERRRLLRKHAASLRRKAKRLDQCMLTSPEKTWAIHRIEREML